MRNVLREWSLFILSLAGLLLGAAPADATAIRVETIEVDVSTGMVAYWERTWFDGPVGNGLPDCNITNLAANGECAAVSATFSSPGRFEADPGPGGLPSVLTFNLVTPFGEANDVGDTVITGSARTVAYIPLPGQPGYAIPNSTPTPCGSFTNCYEALTYIIKTNGSPVVIRFNGEDVTFNVYSNGAMPTAFYDNLVTSSEVPEPATFGLIGSGFVALVVRRRMKRP